MFSVLSRVWDKEKKESNFVCSHVFKSVAQKLLRSEKEAFLRGLPCKFVFYEHLSNLIEVYAKIA